MMEHRVCFKKIIALSLTSLIIAGSVDMPAISVSASEVPSETIYEEEFFEEASLETSAIPISLFSLDDGIVSLKATNEEAWIDRLDLNGADEIRDFYDVLVEASDNDGYCDYLIGDSYFKDSNCLVVCTKTGTVASEEEAINCIQEIYAAYKPYVNAAFQAFDRDHPEVFWLASEYKVGYSAGYSSSDSGIDYTIKIMLPLISTSQQFDIRADGYQSQELIEAGIEVRDAKIEEYVSAVADESAYEQMLYFNEILTKTNQYNTSSNLSGIGHDCRECVSALSGRTGTDGPVCEAYARAFKVLCDKVNIPCVLVDGQASTTGENGAAHMWNYAKVDGAWYGVDVTWDDPTSSQVAAGTAESGYENTKWFLVGSDTLNDKNISFLVSHPVSNQVSSTGVAFTNGPVLNTEAYVVPAYIETDKEAEISGTLGDNGWYRSDVTLHAPTDSDTTWTIAKSCGANAVWSDSIVVTNEGITELTYYLKNSNGEIAKKNVEIKKDTRATITDVQIQAITDTQAEILILFEDTVSGVGSYRLDMKQGTGTPVFSDYDAETNKIGISGLKAGIEYLFTVTVQDNAGNTDTRDVQLLIKAETGTGTETGAETGAGTETETGAGTETETETETESDTSEILTVPKKGQVISDGETNAQYKVTKADSSGGTVAYYRTTKKNATSITIPATISIDGISYKVTAVADKAFKGNKKLTKIIIGKNVTTIGKEAFSGCSKLKTVTLGQNVTTIGDKAFYKCTVLTKITIPSKVNKIGKQSFYGCKKLKNITIKTTKLNSKNVGNTAFTGTHKKVQVKVPAKKVGTYKKLLKQKGISSKAKITK